MIASQVCGSQPEQWAVDRVLRHFGKGKDILFEVLWSSGDTTWARLRDIKHTTALEAYLEAMGAKRASDLPRGSAENVRR